MLIYQHAAGNGLILRPLGPPIEPDGTQPQCFKEIFMGKKKNITGFIVLIKGLLFFNCYLLFRLYATTHMEKQNYVFHHRKRLF
jgi:hypothetical protein